MSSPMCIVYKRLYHQAAKALRQGPQLLHCLSLFIGSIRQYMVGCKVRNCTPSPFQKTYSSFFFNYDWGLLIFFFVCYSVDE